MKPNVPSSPGKKRSWPHEKNLHRINGKEEGARGKERGFRMPLMHPNLRDPSVLLIFVLVFRSNTSQVLTPNLFPTRVSLSTSAVILSPALIQLRRSRSASRRRRKLLDASRRVRSGTRMSANSSKDEFTSHSFCRFFYMDVRRGLYERRSTICCGAFIKHA